MSCRVATGIRSGIVKLLEKAAPASQKVAKGGLTSSPPGDSPKGADLAPHLKAADLMTLAFSPWRLEQMRKGLASLMNCFVARNAANA